MTFYLLLCTPGFSEKHSILKGMHFSPKVANSFLLEVLFLGGKPILIELTLMKVYYFS